MLSETAVPNVDHLPPLRPLVWLACVTASCAMPAPPGGEAAEDVRSAQLLNAVPGPTAVTLRNNAGERVFYRVFPTTSLVFIKWAPCVQIPACPSIPSGGSSALPYDSIAPALPNGASLTVYSWVARPTGGGVLAPDHVRSREVIRPR